VGVGFILGCFYRLFYKVCFAIQSTGIKQSKKSFFSFSHDIKMKIQRLEK